MLCFVITKRNKDLFYFNLDKLVVISAFTKIDLKNCYFHVFVNK